MAGLGTLGYPGLRGSPPTAILQASISHQSHQLLALFPSMPLQQTVCYFRGHNFTIALKGSQRFLGIPKSGRGQLTQNPETGPFSAPHVVLLSSQKRAVHSLGPLLCLTYTLASEPPTAFPSGFNTAATGHRQSPWGTLLQHCTECGAGVPAVTHRSWLQP